MIQEFAVVGSLSLGKMLSLQSLRSETTRIQQEI